MIKKLLRYCHTLRYLRFSQLYWRLFYSIRRSCRFYRLPKTADPPPPFNPETLRRIDRFLKVCHAEGLHQEVAVDALRNQALSFLGIPMESQHSLPWEDNQYPKLWRYQLNSFSFLRDFAVNAAKDDYLGDRDRALHWINDWIEHTAPGSGCAWDGGPLSDRLLNWPLLIAVFKLQEPQIRSAYARQLLWLASWLEYDLRANHLLKNACALAAAGELTGHKELFKKGMHLLEEQLKEQLHADGGHFENSPMYHVQVLWDCLLAYVFLEEKPVFLKEALINMSRFLEKILHPDGDIPLFGDSVLGAGPAPKTLIRLVHRMLETDGADFPEKGGEDVDPASGFYILDNPAGDDRMIVKTTAPSPDYQPGHSHCDVFSYELSLAGLRCIVDSGVHGYAESELRAYCRSTAAHNTAQLDGYEQADLWKTFRVARRSKRSALEFQTNEEEAILCGTLTHFKGHQHERRIHYDRKAEVWTIQDCVDNFIGDQRMKSFIHFHPTWTIQIDQNLVRGFSCGVTIELELSSESGSQIDWVLEQESFFYCPEMGVVHVSPTLILSVHGKAPLRLAYRLRKG